MGSAQELQPDFDATVSFLQALRPGGPWNLVAIEPNRKGIKAKTFKAEQEQQIRGWLEEFNTRKKWGCYFTLNSLMRPLDKKPEQADIKSMDWLHIDLDPRAGEDVAQEQVRIKKLIDDMAQEPTMVIFSGGGWQAFWKLKEPVEINGQEELYEDAKLYNLQLELLNGGDNCHNVDRIMRLPGTVNWPGKRKREKGRKPALAELIKKDGPTYDIAQFSKSPEVQNNTASSGRSTVQISGNVKRIDDLGTLDLPADVKRVIAMGTDPDEPGRWNSRSEPLWWVVCEMVRAEIDDETIYSIITDPDWSISAHVLDQSRPEDYAIRQIERAKDEAIDPMLRELNDKYAVVIVTGGGTRVLAERTERVGDQSRRRIDYMSFTDFRNFYSNRYVTVSTGQSTTLQQAGRWWLGHKNRRTYDGVVFAPGKDVPDYFNLWLGFAYEPKAGDCGLYLAHLKDNICRGDPELSDYLLNWMAATVQRLEEPGHVAVVLRGRQGTGKGVFANVFGELFGSHYVRISSSKHLLGNFNAHMEDCMVLFADEAVWAGDKQGRGVLKSLVTENDILIERKGIDAHSAKSHLHVIMASNEDWVVPAEADDRRFFVLDVGDGQMQEKAYFKAISEQMQAGGRQALLHELMNRDISDFDPRDRPETKALQEQKSLSLDPRQEWLLGLLEDGVLPNNVDGQPNVAFSTETGDGIRNGLADHGREHVPALRHRSVRFFMVYLSKWGVEKSKGGKAHWTFPPLGEMRARWDREMGAKGDWNGPDEWQPLGGGDKF